MLMLAARDLQKERGCVLWGLEWRARGTSVSECRSMQQSSVNLEILVAGLEKKRLSVLFFLWTWWCKGWWGVGGRMLLWPSSMQLQSLLTQALQHAC